MVPTFFDLDDRGLPVRWIARMRQSIVSIGPRFSSARMVRDYAEKAYGPLIEAPAAGARA